MNSSRKLLVVAHFHPDGVHGGPYVMRQLLRGYPKDRLAWWCAERPPAVADFVPRHQIHGRPLPVRLVAHKRFRALKNILVEQLWVRRAARDLRTCMDLWAPEDVVVLLHDWLIPAFARAWTLPTDRRLHVIVHDFMDHARYSFVRGEGRARRFMRDTERLYALADSRTVISAEMAQELRRVTGRETDLIAPCGVEPDERRHIQDRSPPAPRTAIRIAYPGTITAPGTMSRFMAALGRARSAVPCPVWIDFYGGSDARRNSWFQSEWMTYGGIVSDAELTRRLRSASFGLCLMDDDLSNPRYDRYSFPCKFTTCLAAGLPIIAVGHPESALIRVMDRFPVGLKLEGDALQTWSDKLAAFMTRPDPGVDVREAMMQAAESLFDADKNRRAFQALIAR
jgi:hypothetical protein